MRGRLIVHQRLRTPVVNLRLLRQILRSLVNDLVRKSVIELGVYVVDAGQMTELNETFLRHRGSTDVITFDYTEGAGGEELAGEIFVCLPEAEKQARRFRVHWQAELVRYVVHGVLHLCGHDDRRRAERARMKREENRLLKSLEARFDLRQVALVRGRK